MSERKITVLQIPAEELLNPKPLGPSFTVHGYDQYGKPVTEVCHETALSRALAEAFRKIP